MNITTARALTATGMAALLACLALTGCEREPTPKLGSSGDPGLSSPTAQADTGTAMGTGLSSVSGASGVSAQGGGLQAPSTVAQAGDPGGMGTSPSVSQSGPSFDAMTRSEPTGAGMPTSRQAGDVATVTTAGPLSGAERDFIARTGAKSLFEIRVSELAAEKATDPALKSYAAMVAADHKGASEELKRLAAGHGVDVPQTLSAPDQKTLSALQNASGAAFDKQYLQTVGVNEHEKTIAAFEKAGNDARNPAVKDYVQSTLPTLKSHLDAARKLQAKG